MEQGLLMPREVLKYGNVRMEPETDGIDHLQSGKISIKP